jgi:hypothetical protein
MSDILLSKQDQLTLQILDDLNKPRGFGLDVGLKTRLHSSQIEDLKPLYQGKVRNVFLACGRKYGKTELAGYVLWRQALMHPGSECFYITPEAVGGRKIIWEGGRLQKFLGKDSEKYIASIRNQDMTIKLKNGSYIQVVGSDNYMIANGLTPSIAVYDEFKGFNYRWHQEFAPNRVVKDAPFVFIGTKPRAGNKNLEQYNEILEYAKTSSAWYVAERTTFDNPINQRPEIKAAIEEEIAQLRARGEEDVVQLEYFSKVVPGGKKAIFPMLTKERHVKPHTEIMSEIKRDIRKLDWFCITDPGSTTCHATLFAAVHPYTRKLYIVDELYETNQAETSTRRIYPKMDSKMNEFYPNSNVNDDWIKGFDEAAAWFSTEVMEQYGVYFMPTQKHLNKKEHGLSLIKDLLLFDLVVISDRCENLFKEMELYAKDEKGNIPKKNDHLIDCLRYLLGFANYNMIEVMERKKAENDYHRERFRRMEHDKYLYPSKEEDWTYNLGGFHWE